MAKAAILRRQVDGSGRGALWRRVQSHAAWFRYSTYTHPSERETIQKWLGALRPYRTVGIIGRTALARKLIKRIARGGAPKVLCVVDETAISEPRDDVPDGIPVVQWEAAPWAEVEGWVLADPDHGYVHYKRLRAHGVPYSRIVYNSLFHRSPWELSDFHAALRPQLSAMPETMLDDARQLMLVECVKASARLEGGMLEVGTYKGGSGFLICQTLELLGQPKSVTLIDWYAQQSAEVRVEDVRRTFTRFPFAEVISGKIEEVLPALPRGPLCFAHIDISPEETDRILPGIYERLVPGGMLLFDNYYFRYFCKYNFDRFAASVGEQILLLPSVPQGLLVRTRS